MLTGAEKQILGPDVEHDGVRDDVQDRLAVLHGNDAALTDAATIFARAVTRSAILGARGARPTAAQLGHLKAELDCYWAMAKGKGFEPLPASRIEALVVNDSERLKAYLDFVSNASGVPTEPSADAPCTLAQATSPAV
ncbi:MAG TPA: hypothetical protein PK177_11990 [Burkholderiaceae bacterium]|nr:hypothetical protein [Burkholderiaceae bacterium]